MVITKKKHYNSDTLAFKAVKESNKQGIRAIDVAEALGIYPVMLYRWRQEAGLNSAFRQGLTVPLGRVPALIAPRGNPS